MAQEDGWPLGLRPLSRRGGGGEGGGGVIRNQYLSHGGSTASFSTLISASPTSMSNTSSSSDVDTKSSIGSGSFFQDRSITLGRLIGITTMLDISSNSISHKRRHERGKGNKKRNNDKVGRANSWFSPCFRAPTSRNVTAPSLGDFLEFERRMTYEMHGLEEDANSLFANGCIIPQAIDDVCPTILDGDDIKLHACCW